MREVVPAELRTLHQWVSWQWSTDKQARKTKVPFVPGTGVKASVADSTTWRSFDAAYAADPFHIGFVFTADDPYLGIDLDGCRNPHTEELALWATEIVARFPGAYAEVSPSKSGLKLWIRGSLPRDATGALLCKNRCEIKGEAVLGDKGKAMVEVYDHNRYFTVTGESVVGPLVEIREQQDSVDWLVARYLLRQTPPSAAHAGGSLVEPHLDDEEILRRARRAKNSPLFTSLYDQGDFSAYASQSEADAALACLLAFWTRDAGQIERLFRGSALYRPKWDERHFSDGRTYGTATVEGALETVQVFRSARQDLPSAHQPGRDAILNSFNRSDVGNAEAFAFLNGDSVRYLHQGSEWLMWRGHWWEADTGGEVKRAAMTLPRARLSAAVTEPDQSRREVLVKCS